MRVLVAGATGFIGRHLVPALEDDGHEVRAMTRRPENYSGAGTPVGADVSRPETLREALTDVDAAYYLVHSLQRRDFRRYDAAAARAFATAAADAGVGRIVYLGGLGDAAQGLSTHLASRQEVEGLLGAAGVPVTTLRAGIVIGHSSASWEMLHNLVERFPALAVPQWGQTRTQPIALSDAIRYLVGVLPVEDRTNYTFEIGGADVLRYVDMLDRLALIEGRRSLLVPVWLPSLRLAALGASAALPLVTGVGSGTIRSLIESMGTEVVVRDDMIRSVVPFEPRGYDDAVLEALGARARARRKR